MKQAILILLGSVAAFAALGRIRWDDAGPRGAGTLEFWTYAGGGSADRSLRFWNEVARGFEKANPGVRVRTVTGVDHNNYMQVLTVKILSGNAPDVFICDDGQAVAFNQDRLLMPLEEFIRNDKSYRTEDFPAGMVADGYVGPTRYSIPWYGGYGCLVYRTDLLAKAGVAPPETWDQLVSACQALREKAGLRYPLAMEVNGAFWMWAFVWQNGGDLLSPDQRRVTIDTPEFAGALQFVHDLIYKHKAIDPSLARGGSFEKLWASGQAALMINGCWLFGQFDDNWPEWKGKWEVAPLPAGRHRVSFYGGQHLAMARTARNPELAWRFMSYATSAQVQRRWTRVTGSPPGNLRAFDDEAFRRDEPHFVRTRGAIETGRNNPLAPFTGDLWYGRLTNLVLRPAMEDPRADIPALLARARPVMQRIVDDYWASHRYFLQGRPRP